jgi:flagellar FliL protein
MPAIRNSLVLLLSRQVYDELLPDEGKEKLRGEALAAVQGVLQAQLGKPGIEDLYFTNFVMH